MLVAALLAYPLHYLLPDSLGFRSLVSRGAMAVIFISLFPLAAKLQIKATDFGWVSSPHLWFRQVLQGLGIGTLMLSIHVLVLIALDVRRIDQSHLQSVTIVLGWLGKALLTGIAVGLIEETLFRGLLQGGLTRFGGPMVAVLVSAFYYAGAHFLRTDLKPASGSVQWDSGLLMIWDAFSNLSQIQADTFLALFCVGVFLAGIRAYLPSSLGYCIGIHAGWVFVIKSAKHLSFVVPHNEWAGMVSHYDGIIGYFSALWLAALCLLLIGLRRKFRTPPLPA